MQRDIPKYQQPPEARKWSKDERDRRDEDLKTVKKYEVPRSPTPHQQSPALAESSYTPLAAQMSPLLRAIWAVIEDEDLTEDIHEISNQLDIDFEQLFSVALNEFVKKYGGSVQTLTEDINAAYDEELKEEDEAFLSQIKSYQGRIIDADG